MKKRGALYKTGTLACDISFIAAGSMKRKTTDIPAQSSNNEPVQNFSACFERNFLMLFLQVQNTINTP